MIVNELQSFKAFAKQHGWFVVPHKFRGLSNVKIFKSLAEEFQGFCVGKLTYLIEPIPLPKRVKSCFPQSLYFVCKQNQ